MLKNRIIFSFIASLFLSLIAFISNSHALKTDRDQPADISSDEVDVDLKTGRRTFIGNVRFVQGTLRVKGDRVDATFKDGKLVEAIAYGKPAAFRQRPDGKEHDVEGRGLTIVLNQKDNLLTLKKKASLKQGPDVARGAIIIYNMATDKLKIKGGAVGEKGERKPNSGPSKTETDPFFTEPSTDLKSSNKTNEKKAPVTNIPVEPDSNSSLRPSDELPEKLVLPGQSNSSDSGRETPGRSRLIIRPNSN